VITTHIARAWDYRLFWPKDAIDAPSPRLLQLPIIRVPFQGRVGVPIFAFLTGFVCAYKPLKLAYLQGNALASLQSVARSAFRRPPRLVLPAAMATFMSFVLTLFGGYRTATRCDSFWVRFDAPNQEPTFAKEVRRLSRALLTTWTDTDNPYDRHQWAMRPLLIGAFQVYVCLAATLRMRFRYRILVHVLLMVYWMLNNNELAGRSRSLFRPLASSELSTWCSPSGSFHPPPFLPAP
jgi:Acyltransferase family